MNISFTGDNHVFNTGTKSGDIKYLMDKMLQDKPDVVVNLGDLGEILFPTNKNLEKINCLLNTFEPTLYILGNHDLYARPPTMVPPLAMLACLNKIKYGIPLQLAWDDSKTIYIKDDCVFCGTMGWPDFVSPRLSFSPYYYERQAPTVDSTHIDLSSGWKQYTASHFEAFKIKLKKVVGLPINNIIIATHYPIFDGQHTIDGSDMSAFFFCYTIGQMIRNQAAQYPQKKFFCIAAHGHEYNCGRWIQEANNIFVYGLVTIYATQDHFTFDTKETLFA